MAKDAFDRGRRRRITRVEEMRPAFRLVRMTLGLSIFSYIHRWMRKSREDKKRETKKGWHEDHSKVEKLDYPHREKLIRHIIIPRIRISFPVLISN